MGDYDLQLGRFGSLDVAPLVALQLGADLQPDRHAVPLSAIQLARNPATRGCRTAGAQTLFFGERGAEIQGLRPGRPRVPPTRCRCAKTLRPWVKVEIFNLLNNQKLISWNTTVTPDPNSALDANGLPTGYIKGATFGTARVDRPTTRAPRPRRPARPSTPGRS